MSTLSLLLASSLPSASASAQQKAYVTYSFPIHSTDGGCPGTGSVTLLESRSVISGSGTTGLRTWEAALLLGSFLASEKGQDLIQGKNILELGAGTGMLSILCAKHLGISGVIATDGDEAVVDAIKTNAFLNEEDGAAPFQGLIRTAALKWGRYIQASAFAEDYGLEAPDVVLGADVVSQPRKLPQRAPAYFSVCQTYDQTGIPSLVSTMRDFLDMKPAAQVIIAATIRNESTFQTFLDACSTFLLGPSGS